MSPWSTANETSDALGALVAAATRQVEAHSWLGAIISSDRQSHSFVGLAQTLEVCGFKPVHVPAAVPADFASLQDMLAEAFGNGTHHAAGLTPFEVGCFLSHKRALAALARSRFQWGAVFEEDATLHASVLPSHAALLIQRAIAAAASEAVLYLGACSPRCANATTTTAHGLPPWLLSGARCLAYCTHAYALSARRAASFFESVFCHGGPCGRDCAKRRCYMDWAMSRHFLRGHDAWIVGGGFQSPWVGDHRGLFVQNRTTMLKGGTTLRRSFQWRNSSLGQGPPPSPPPSPSPSSPPPSPPPTAAASAEGSRFFETALKTTTHGYIRMQYLLPEVSRSCAPLHSKKSIIWIGAAPGAGKTTIAKRFQQYGFTTLECEDKWARKNRLESIYNGSLLAANLQSSLIVAACDETYLLRAPDMVVPILILPTFDVYTERWKNRNPKDTQHHNERFNSSVRISMEMNTKVRVLHQYVEESVDETVRRICEIVKQEQRL